MKKLLSNKNILLIILINTAIFLYGLFFSYNVICNKELNNDFYAVNIVLLFNCIITTLLTANFYKVKKYKIRVNTNEKVINEKLIKNKKIKIIDPFVEKLFFILILFYLITNWCCNLNIIFLPFIPQFMIILHNLFKYENKSIVFDYNDNCLLFDNEKIPFEEIKEYSIKNSIVDEYTLHLSNRKELKIYAYCYPILTLIKNLHYLKIPERILD